MRVGCAHIVNRTKNVPEHGSSTSLSYQHKLSSNFSVASSEGAWDLAICWTCVHKVVGQWHKNLTKAVKFSDLSMFLADRCLSSAGEESQIYGPAMIPFVIESSVT